MPGTELSTFIQRLAKRVSCRMNDTNQEPHEGPRNLRAISRVVTEAAGSGLAPRLPCHSVANRPRGVAEGEATGARGRPGTPGLLWRNSAGVESSQCGRRSRRVEPPPGPRLRPSSSYSRRTASLRMAGPSPSAFSLRRARPLARGGHAHVRQKRVFHWPLLGGGAGERSASPLESVQVAAAGVEEGEVAQAMWPTLRYVGGVCGLARYSVAGGFLRASGPASGGPGLLCGGGRSSSSTR